LTPPPFSSKIEPTAEYHGEARLKYNVRKAVFLLLLIGIINLIGWAMGYIHTLTEFVVLSCVTAVVAITVKAAKLSSDEKGTKSRKILNTGQQVENNLDQMVRNPKWMELFQKEIKDTMDWVHKNVEQNNVIISPILILFLDITLRSVIRVDISDVGADMSLLAIAILVSLIMRDGNKEIASQYRTRDLVPFFILFLLIWALCLRIVALKDLEPILVFGMNINLYIICILSSLFLGLFFLMIAAIIAKCVIETDGSKAS